MQRAELLLDTGVTHHFEAEMVDGNLHDNGALKISLYPLHKNYPTKMCLFGPRRWISLTIWEDENDAKGDSLH